MREEHDSLIHRKLRRPIGGVFVAIDAPEVAQQPWVVDAIDLSSEGLGLVLPPELHEGAEVFLTFVLDDVEFARVPAVVRHREGQGGGGVQFGEWDEDDRLRLLESLVEFYENG